MLERGNGNRRTASTDWNERSSRSHSVFRLVIESRERGSGGEEQQEFPTRPPTPSGRCTPVAGGPRLQARGGRSVQTSVLVCDIHISKLVPPLLTMSLVFAEFN